MALQAVVADRLDSGLLGLGAQRLLADHAAHRLIVENLPFGIALGIALGPFALCLFVSHYIDVNKFSMHSTYRNRLMRAYLGASRPTRSPNWFTGFDDEDNIPMHELWPGKPNPGQPDTPERKKLLHVINLTLNLVQGSNLAWQQRKAESFTITPLHCGGYHVGYRRASMYGDHKGISLGTAMAISGAAASPNMGYHSSTLVSLVMTIFNARLGAWLGNPGVPGESKVQKSPTTWSVGPLVREAFGMTTDRDSYVYLSDGGHFENLGLYEMVLRRCRYIVVSDASGDPDYKFTDLGNAVRKIRIDLGVPIEFDREIAIGRDGKSKFSGSYCAVGTIKYSRVDGPSANDGVLIYLKPAIIRGEPRDVLDYAESSITFPQESEVDQFFSESQFEAYRALGEHMVERICSTFKGQGGFTALEARARTHASQAEAKLKAAAAVSNGVAPTPAVRSRR